MINKLVSQLWKGACVVLDNSSIHKGEEIKAAVEAVGAKARVLILSRLPNSIKHENLWSKLKNILRRIGARTYQDLEQASAIAYAQISLDNIRIAVCTLLLLHLTQLRTAITPYSILKTLLKRKQTR